MIRTSEMVISDEMIAAGITEQMIEEGFAVLRSSCLVDDLLEGERQTVAEIYLAMERSRNRSTILDM